jgi:hypothetical protein
MLINSKLLQKYVHKDTNNIYDNELKHLILYKNIINDDGNAVVKYTRNCMFGRSNAYDGKLDILYAHPCFL